MIEINDDYISFKEVLQYLGINAVLLKILRNKDETFPEPIEIKRALYQIKEDIEEYLANNVLLQGHKKKKGNQ